MTNYSDVIEYLYKKLPVFQKQGSGALNYKLDKITQMCEDLDSPHLSFKAIHVAGTNGKGSTSHYIAAALQANGYKVGLYTSPHLKEFTERIKINGQEIEQEEVVQFVQLIKPIIEKYEPSFFEVTVLMAFYHFARQKVDVAVIEVGLGGRFDSTNIITPLLSVITNIGLDHQFILGDTLEQIASEKAGIIKKGIPVIIGERQTEIEHVFLEKASSCQSKLIWAEKEEFSPLESSVYLEKNQKTAFAALKYLFENQLFDVDLSNVKEAFGRVTVLTGLKGRWQVLSQKPTVVCDTGHNIDGIKMILKQLERYNYNQLIVVLGFVSDKDVQEVLSLLPKTAYYICCQANIQRAMKASELSQEMAKLDLEHSVVEGVNQAVKLAKTKAASDDFIWIGGSTFVVAEIDGL